MEKKKQNMANLDKLIKKQLDDAYDTDEESETEEEESDVTEEQAGA